MPDNSLKAALASILAKVATLPKERDRPSIKKPSTPAQLDKLAKTLGLKQLPADLATWFRAHGGSSTRVDPDAKAMSWLSIPEAISEWKFLCDPREEVMKPWSNDWLPIATNGGGDFYVYVLRGDKKGQVLFYLHDDRRRSVQAKSLADYATKLDKRLTSVKKSIAQKGALPKHLIDDPSSWKDVPAPTADEIAKAPLGTAFHERALPYQSYWFRVYVKVAKGTWIMGRAQGKNVAEIAPALKDAEQRLAEKLPREWKVTDAQMVAGFSDEKTYPEGLSALEGKSPRKDPYFIRRRGQLRLE